MYKRFITVCILPDNRTMSSIIIGIYIGNLDFVGRRLKLIPSDSIFSIIG
jgi:hypothetical protein